MAFWQEHNPASVELTKQWKQIGDASPVHKRYVSVQIPTFSVTGLTWNNASIISYEFAVALPDTFTVRLPFPTPSNPNFVLAVRFGSAPTRYKFWEGIGEDLNYPLYNGEQIDSSCVFEVWTIASSTVTSSSGLEIGVSNVFKRTGCSDASLAAQLLTEDISALGDAPGTVEINPYTANPLPLVFN